MNSEIEPTDAEKEEEEKRDAYRWERRCDVLFRVWVQFRYHRRKQRFFDLCDKLTKAATLILGGAVLGKWVNLDAVAILISVLGSLALVLGYGDKKQAHKELAEMAGKIIASLERDPQEYSAESLRRWWDSYLELCVKAPPPSKWLTIRCEREQRIAQGNIRPKSCYQKISLRRLVLKLIVVVRASKKK